MNINLPKHLNTWKIVLMVALFCVGVAILYFIYPIGVDWKSTFGLVGQTLADPYSVPTFVNPPFTLLFIPHAVLPLQLGNAMNMAITFVVLALVASRGGVWAIVLCFTSPTFFALAGTNNIDWIPLVAFLVQPVWAKYVLVAVKPQVLGGAVFVWLRKHGVRPLIPVIAVFILSVLLYRAWFTQTRLPHDFEIWNFSPFPLLVPIGLYLLWYGYTKQDEVIAACATPCLAPYFGAYSLAPLFALIAGRDKRVAFVIWLAFWVYLILRVAGVL